MNNNDILNKDNEYTKNQIYLISAVEKERKRMAAELHDTTLQNLTHVLYQMELSEMYLKNDIMKSKLEMLSARNNLKSVIADIRNLIFDLRPMSFDDLGLRETFDNLIAILKKYSDFEFIYNVDDIKNKDEYFLISIYRIAREALMNAIKHSGGNKIIFNCVRDENIIKLMILDNGKGLPENSYDDKNHFGINLMKERVNFLKGSINITSDCGTKVSIEIPIDNEI